MKSIRAIIFDLDGVLVSTDEQHYQAWNALAERLGIPFDREANDRFRGVSRMACMDMLAAQSGRSYSAEEKLDHATWKNDRYRALLSGLSPADLSAEHKLVLDELRARGYLLAIGSSSRNAKTILARLGLTDYFDAVSDGTNITRSKPDPEVFLAAATALGVPPESCLVVEDAVSGVDAARAAGMPAIAVGDASEKLYGDYNLSRLSELPALVASLGAL